MNDGVTFRLNTDEYILHALKEDITSEDVTTNAVMPDHTLGEAQLIAKEDGILCGLQIFERVFHLLDEATVFTTSYKDGDTVKSGSLVGTLTGDIRVLLSGERTALNYLQRMSGIATFTRSFSDELAPYKTRLLDTRKTTPNMRPFEKYAVTVGGGYNHRYNLSDGVLLKDNHIGAAGGVRRAIEMAREYAPLEMVREDLDAGADIIMLDNMDNQTMAEAVRMIGSRALTECSGNVTRERLREIAELGVDYVSSGALTHSAPILDLSLKNLKPLAEPDEKR